MILKQSVEMQTIMQSYTNPSFHTGCSALVLDDRLMESHWSHGEFQQKWEMLAEIKNATSILLNMLKF